MRRVLITLLLVSAGAAVAYSLNRRAGSTSEPSDPAAQRETRRRATPTTGTPIEWDHPPDAGVEASNDVAQAPHFDLADLDFEAIRQQTPNSLYWLLAAPTDDVDVLRARAEVREARNQQYGKVVSSTATEDEIRDYYAYRRTLSEDYIEVLQLILDEHGADLSERDIGLFELTISMHSARLAEIPTKLDDALQRKAEYDRVKQEWQEQQERSDGSP